MLTRTIGTRARRRLQTVATAHRALLALFLGAALLAGCSDDGGGNSTDCALAMCADGEICVQGTGECAPTCLDDADCSGGLVCGGSTKTCATCADCVNVCVAPGTGNGVCPVQ